VSEAATRPTPRPADHPASALTGTGFDVVVLGGGPTGENVADYVRRGGLTAVVVEPELVGGECSYWACMPSKALLRPVEVLSGARAVAGAREALAGELDVAAVLARRDSFTSDWDDAGQVRWLDGAGIALARGAGRLAGERTVQVTGPDGQVVLLHARHAVVVCTGSRATVPPVDGLADVRPWTSRDATGAPSVPGRLAVLGGGVVGVEAATAWNALGSDVVLLQRGRGLLPSHEPEVGTRVAAALRDRGVEVRTGVTTSAARRDADGRVVLTTQDGDVLADEVLVATGRAPRTDDLGLASVGLEDGDWLDVDDTLLVRGVEGSWLYAAGDVNHRSLLTHMGKYQARACAAAVLARARGELASTQAWAPTAATADVAAVPQVVFTVPEVGSVGRTLAQAQEAGLRVRAVDHEIGAVAGAALLRDGYDGWARLVVDLDRDVVVGATFLGAGTAELVHSATVAVVGEVPLDRLWHAVPAYPTVSEVWLRLLEDLRSG
jgi:pyruvate/2-oxoglutarate dehydrogenase complex dihydrolipoamide dehydrogenase (E3) component